MKKIKPQKRSRLSWFGMSLDKPTSSSPTPTEQSLFIRELISTSSPLLHLYLRVHNPRSLKNAQD